MEDKAFDRPSALQSAVRFGREFGKRCAKFSQTWRFAELPICWQRRFNIRELALAPTGEQNDKVYRVRRHGRC
jgi:hypothetical protein